MCGQLGVAVLCPGWAGFDLCARVVRVGLRALVVGLRHDDVVGLGLRHDVPHAVVAGDVVVLVEVPDAQFDELPVVVDLVELLQEEVRRRLRLWLLPIGTAARGVRQAHARSVCAWLVCCRLAQRSQTTRRARLRAGGVCGVVRGQACAHLPLSLAAEVAFFAFMFFAIACCLPFFCMAACGGGSSTV